MSTKTKKERSEGTDIESLIEKIIIERQPHWVKRALDAEAALAEATQRAEKAEKELAADEAAALAELGVDADAASARIGSHVDALLRLKRQVAFYKKTNEFLHERRGEVCIERDTARDRVRLLEGLLRERPDRTEVYEHHTVAYGCGGAEASQEYKSWDDKALAALAPSPEADNACRPACDGAVHAPDCAWAKFNREPPKAATEGRPGNGQVQGVLDGLSDGDLLGPFDMGVLLRLFAHTKRLEERWANRDDAVTKVANIKSARERSLEIERDQLRAQLAKRDERQACGCGDIPGPGEEALVNGQCMNCRLMAGPVNAKAGWSWEEHGDGWALYEGRDINSHGLNRISVSNRDAFDKDGEVIRGRIAELLNRHGLVDRVLSGVGSEGEHLVIHDDVKDLRLERDQALKCLSEAPTPQKDNYWCDGSYADPLYVEWYTSEFRQDLLKGVK